MNNEPDNKDKAPYIDNVAIGDCVDVMKSMPDNIVDLTVTSPPYGSIRDYNGFQLSFENIIEQLYRITAERGIVVWVCADQTKNGSESGESFKQALMFMKAGFSLYDTMIYAKVNPIPLTHRRYEQEFEYMFVFCKGSSPMSFNPIMVDKKTSSNPGHFRQRSDGVLEKSHSSASNTDKKQHGNIWWYSVGKNKSSKDARAFMHPATFPEQLAEEQIYSWSNEGDLVFDPFAGSGTTLITAKKMNRRFYGCDISEHYVNDIIIPRLDDLQDDEE